MEVAKLVEIPKALIQLRKILVQPTFNKKAVIPNRPIFWYADLGRIIQCLDQFLPGLNLTYTQTLERDEKCEPWLVTILMHVSGESLVSRYPLPVGVRPSELGSAITFGKRYSLCAMFGLFGEEDMDDLSPDTEITEKPPVAKKPVYDAQVEMRKKETEKQYQQKSG